MQNGSHFTAPAEPAPRRLRRAAGVACGAVAVGAAAMLVIDVTGGSHRRKVTTGVPASHEAAATVGVPASDGAATSVVPPAPTATSAAPTTTTATIVRPPAVLPDGSALPVLVVFNGATITLAGSVPNQADADRLRALAVANSKTAASVIDHLVVDSRVPASVGVRVIEMNAVRFGEGSSDISPDYAPGAQPRDRAHARDAVGDDPRHRPR